MLVYSQCQAPSEKATLECDSLPLICPFFAAKCSNSFKARIEAKWNLVSLEIFYSLSSAHTTPGAQLQMNINKINCD